MAVEARVPVERAMKLEKSSRCLRKRSQLGRPRDAICVPVLAHRSFQARVVVGGNNSRFGTNGAKFCNRLMGFIARFSCHHADQYREQRLS